MRELSFEYRYSLNVARRQRLGDEVRLIAGMQLVSEILDVPLYGSRGNTELLRALLGRQSARNALEHFALALR